MVVSKRVKEREREKLGSRCPLVWMTQVGFVGRLLLGKSGVDRQYNSNERNRTKVKKTKKMHSERDTQRDKETMKHSENK